LLSDAIKAAMAKWKSAEGLEQEFEKRKSAVISSTCTMPSFSFSLSPPPYKHTFLLLLGYRRHRRLLSIVPGAKKVR
jgi:hypothetical protein